MVNCDECGKKVGFFDVVGDLHGNSFCSAKCKNKFTRRKNKEKMIVKKESKKEKLKKIVFKGPKWEYKVVRSSRKVEERLNALGAEGWELVSVCYDSAGYNYYLKRPMATKKKSTAKKAKAKTKAKSKPTKKK